MRNNNDVTMFSFFMMEYINTRLLKKLIIYNIFKSHIGVTFIIKNIVGSVNI